VKALAEFTANAPPSIDADLHPEYLLLSRPFLPRPWLTSGRKTLDPEREFPRQGQVHLPQEAFARDSGYEFYLSSLMAGEGDPARFTEELRKEQKNRRAGVLLSWAQVEYYHLPPGLRKSLYPQTPDDWVEWECPAGMAVPLPTVVTYRGSRLIRGDSLHWRIFYAEWVLNATVRFITDAHHRGLLWRLPSRVIDNISVLGLPFLLEGTRYDLEKVTQLLGLVRSEDWKGYEQVGALSIQLVGTSFTSLAMETPLPVLDQVVGGEVTVTGEDEVEEILASGGPPEQTLPPGRSPRRKGVSPAIPRRTSGQVLEERPILRSAVPAVPPSTTGGHNMMNTRGSGQTPEGWEQEQPRLAPRYLERVEREKYEGRAREGASGSRITRISSEMRPVASTAVDVYAPRSGYQYSEEMVEGYDLRERARELEEYLQREGRYAEFLELAGSSDIVTHIVGRVIFTLLEDRDGHRRQDVALRQRIVDLEVALDGAFTRNRGTSQRLRMVVDDLADTGARCDPTSGTRRRSDGEGEVGVERGGQGRKRTRTGAEKVWTDVDPRYR
jgi:hypothetical protein